ncbi:MAG: glycosyltransferase family 4 protein, partial [Bryobacteraceae bacterium]
MKLVVLTDRYIPEARAAAYLCRGLAEGLVSRGHEVLVLTRYPTKFVPGDGRTALPKEESIKGVKVVRVASLFGGSWPVLRGLDQVAVSMRIAMRLLRATNPDAVLVSSPPLPLTIAAILAKKLRGTPYVIHLHDLYPQTAIDLGILKNRWLIGLMRWIESAAYRNSGRIVAAAPATLNILRSHSFLAANRASFVSNFVDLRHCDAAGPGTAFCDDRKTGKGFVILYAGLMGHAQDMSVILACARRAGTERPDWQFVLAGDGP